MIRSAASPRWPGCAAKLTRITVLVAMLALLLDGVLVARYIDHTNARQEALEIGFQARELAETIAAARAFDDRATAQRYLNTVHVDARTEVAALYDAGGHLFAFYRSSPDVTLPATVTTTPPQLREGRRVVAVPVTQGAATLGSLYLRSLTEPVGVRLQRYGVIGLLITMASIMVVTLVAAHRAQRHANEELMRQAEQLAIANVALEAQHRHREQAEEALRQAQKMEAIGQLTGGVAHDFNNLLQVTLGNLERLARRLPEAGEAQRDLRRLIDSAMHATLRAAALTHRLLAFSRRQPLAPKPLDLNRLVAGMLELFSGTLGKAIQIETVLAGGLWRVRADQSQLENALANLAVNARDAMPGGGKLYLETHNVLLDATYASTQEDLLPGDYVLISVTDTGVGMTREILARAFDPFFTTKGIGQGAGLGLSQVYGFVRQSGGHVRIDSTPGKGTTVKLYLPRFHEIRTEQPALLPPELPGLRQMAMLDLVEEPAERSFAREVLHEPG